MKVIFGWKFACGVLCGVLLGVSLAFVLAAEAKPADGDQDADGKYFVTGDLRQARLWRRSGLSLIPVGSSPQYVGLGQDKGEKATATVQEYRAHCTTHRWASGWTVDYMAANQAKDEHNKNFSHSPFQAKAVLETRDREVPDETEGVEPK